MLNRNIIEAIEKMDKKYIIGGSNATMIHIGYDIRKCNDLDLHLSKPINISLLENIINMKIDAQYDQPSFTVLKGIRVLKLENIISYKINRLSAKDIYDLSFLLNLNFDINEIKIYSNKDIMEEKENYIKIFYKEDNFYKVVETIEKIRNKTMKESSTSEK